MRCELRSLWSPDVASGSLGDFEPADPSAFGLFVQAAIGPVDGEGEEVFDLMVCSPVWLAAQPFEKGYRWGRGKLLTLRWDPQIVERAVRDICLRSEGEDWAAIARRLAQVMDWEFSGYRG
jgi:hypothetical protein